MFSRSDFWALGCILFQFLAGSPPFRGRTEYLTFQKIKALEYTFPDGFDPDAKDLIERLLVCHLDLLPYAPPLASLTRRYILRVQVLDPSQRLGAGPSGIQEIKNHPFLRGTDFSTLWSKPPPPLESGLVGPPQPVAPRDFFAEMGLDDVQESEEDEEEADDGMGAISPSTSEPRIPSDDEDFEPPKGRWAHKVRHGAKGGSVSSGTASIGTLDPSSAVAQAIVGLGKGRPASINTSISSGYTGGPYSPIGTNSNSPIIPSPADQDRTVSGPWQSPTSKTQKKCVLLSLPCLRLQSLTTCASTLLYQVHPSSARREGRLQHSHPRSFLALDRQVAQPSRQASSRTLPHPHRLSSLALRQAGPQGRGQLQAQVRVLDSSSRDWQRDRIGCRRRCECPEKRQGEGREGILRAHREFRRYTLASPLKLTCHFALDLAVLVLVHAHLRLR